MDGSWALLSGKQVLNYFQVNSQEGLRGKEAKRRLLKNGSNSLKEKKKLSLIGMFLNQFKEFMVLILLVATLLSGLLGEYVDALAIIIIILVNAFLGFLQEFKAEKSLAALKKLITPRVRLIRDMKTIILPAEEVVVGDIVLLDAGDRVPADIRILQTDNMNIDESALTGESVSIIKVKEVLSKNSGNLGDCVNMAFMGTLVISGKGRGVVVATGMDTEMGKIAHLLQEVKQEDTPLQKRLKQLGKFLVLGCLVICFLVAFLGIYRGESFYMMLMAGVSLAVAAIPEGLPAIVTIALAIGGQRMIRRKAIVRRLPAVETLGCATVICSDKTGTLTQNKMTVQEILTGEQLFTLSGESKQIWGHFYCEGKKINPQDFFGLKKTLQAAALCNNAVLQKKGITIKPAWRSSKGRQFSFETIGDPTEGALLIAAIKGGIWREEATAKMKKIKEYPFNSVRKRMGTVYKDAAGKQQIYYKGATDVIIEQCTSFLSGKRIHPLNAEKRREIIKKEELMASRALRNIAVAWKELLGNSALVKEPDVGLVFLGVLGMQDLPRPEALEGVIKSRQAGIKTVMITGDHKATALSIAKKLKLFPRGGEVLTGREIDSLSENELISLVDKVYVYARVTPEHKLRIVRAFKAKGHVVAMTGDGVNDAPAVKEADIGIAMGEIGTDVTREAADLILGDDNYNTIVAAVEEGRNIYDNIKKFIRFLLSCNVGEIMTMLLAMLAGLPLPLRPIQILFINLATDGLPAMALGVDPADRNIMQRPPHSPQESIFSRGLWQKILLQGINIGIFTLIAFAVVYFQGKDLILAQTVAFATLILTQLIHVIDCRKTEENDPNFFSNPYLLAAILSSAWLLYIVIYHPLLQEIFRTVPLDVEKSLLVLGFAAAPTVVSRILYWYRS